MYITNLHVSEAWARFPNQNIINLTEDVTQVIGDRKFTYIQARSGNLHIYITNSVQEKLYLEYDLVGAFDRLGRPLKEYTTVPAAPQGGHVTIDTLLDISGFSINLTGQNGSGFNTYTQRVIARIDSTGQTAHVTMADSLNIRYELSGISPSYIKGYAGRDTIRSSDTSSFSFLNIFKGGTIDLQSVNMNFNVINGIGVDGQVKIDTLIASSPINGSKMLTGPSIVGKPLNINRATDFPLTPSNNNFAINNNNTNIGDLLKILPNRLQYVVEVNTNMHGDNHQYRDFAYEQSGLQIGLNAEIPLSLIANHLLLLDTVNFDLSNTNTNINGITDGVINIIAENQFPIQTFLTMTVYDSVWHPVDTLAQNVVINAAGLDNNCIAQAPTRTKIPEYVNEDRMTRLKTGKHAIISADFSTASNNATCNGQHLKIYANYKLGLTLTARFNYKVKTGF
jgi:hypothetical protein